MKSFNIGSQRENAKQITIKVTRGKVFFFLFICILLAWGVSKVIEDDIKSLYDSEIKIKCINGTTENVEYAKEYYCGEHYTNLKDKFESYNRIKQIVTGIENE